MDSYGVACMVVLIFVGLIAYAAWTDKDRS